MHSAKTARTIIRTWCPEVSGNFRQQKSAELCRLPATSRRRGLISLATHASGNAPGQYIQVPSFGSSGSWPRLLTGESIAVPIVAYASARRTSVRAQCTRAMWGWDGSAGQAWSCRLLPPAVDHSPPAEPEPEPNQALLGAVFVAAPAGGESSPDPWVVGVGGVDAAGQLLPREAAVGRAAPRVRTSVPGSSRHPRPRARSPRLHPPARGRLSRHHPPGLHRPGHHPPRTRPGCGTDRPRPRPRILPCDVGGTASTEDVTKALLIGVLNA